MYECAGVPAAKAVMQPMHRCNGMLFSQSDNLTPPSSHVLCSRVVD